MRTYGQILTVLMAVIMLGSVVVGTNVVLQKASAITGGKDFKDLSTKFKQDVLNLVSADPPQPDREKQLAKLFDDYEQKTLKIFGLTPPSIQAPQLSAIKLFTYFFLTSSS